jgi:hypothetical protein
MLPRWKELHFRALSVFAHTCRLRVFVSIHQTKGESCDALYAILNGRLREAVAPQNGHFNRRATSGMTTSSSTAPPMPQPNGVGRNLSADATSFLSRTRLRLKAGVMENMIKNKPKVANLPPPLSRRMMNAAGEELQGEDFGRGAILGEVELLTGAW